MTTKRSKKNAATSTADCIDMPTELTNKNEEYAFRVWNYMRKTPDDTVKTWICLAMFKCVHHAFEFIWAKHEDSKSARYVLQSPSYTKEMMRGEPFEYEWKRDS